MTQEEKLEEAKRLYETANADQKYVLESLFPELCESEDERIRKEITELVMQPTWKTEKEFHRRNELCAWLEKQGEITKEWSEMKFNNIRTELQEMVALKQKTEQGEQKPVGCPEYCVMSNCANCPYYHPVLIKKLNEWSEEDETVLNNLIYALANDRIGNNRDEYVEYLNSLKDRVQPQSEWSEEDEGKRKRIMHRLSIDGTINNKDLADINDWIKSLRPQNTWKPSEEQMEALDDFIYAKYPNVEKYGAAVKSLYQDLKKLKE